MHARDVDGNFLHPARPYSASRAAMPSPVPYRKTPESPRARARIEVRVAVMDAQARAAQHAGVVRSGEVDVGRRVGEPVGIAPGAVDGGVHDGDDQ